MALTSSTPLVLSCLHTSLTHAALTVRNMSAACGWACEKPERPPRRLLKPLPVVIHSWLCIFRPKASTSSGAPAPILNISICLLLLYLLTHTDSAKLRVDTKQQRSGCIMVLVRFPRYSRSVIKASAIVYLPLPRLVLHCIYSVSCVTLRYSASASERNVRRTCCWMCCCQPPQCSTTCRNVVIHTAIQQRRN